MTEFKHISPFPAKRVLTAVAFAGIFFSCSRDKDSLPISHSQVRSLMNKAAITASNNNPMVAVHYIDSAIYGRRLSLEGKIEVYGFKTDIYNNQLRQYDKAMLYADSMLEMVEDAGKEKYRTEYALANYAKGDVLLNLKKYNDAYSYYYAAQSSGRTNLDSCTLGEYSFRLALVLFRQSRFAEAAHTFISSFKETSTCTMDFGKYFRMQQVLNNTGLSFYKSGNTDSALFYYKQGVAFLEKHSYQFPDRQNLNEVARGVFLGNMADIYRLKGDTAAAKEFLKQSIDINIKPGYDNMDAQYSQVKLAELYADEGYTDSMHHALNVLRASLDSVKNLRAEMDWNRLMWRFYNNAHDVNKAYLHLVQFKKLQDSLNAESSQIKSTDLSQQINMLEGQYQIRALQKDNELSKVYLWIAVLASVLAIMIVFFIFRNLVRSRKNVALLQSLNNQVNEQKTQLQQALSTVEEKNLQQDRILRAVAHDLRGPVATIAMLCDLVEREEDKAARKEMIEFIRTSCNNSLQLIAEILEAADQSKRKELEKELVDIKALITEAVQLLQMKAAEKEQVIQCDLPESKIVLNVNADKIKRVINNLVTNAIKFSPKGAVTRIGIEEAPGSAIISVEDNGIGIPDSIGDKVFDMFTEAKRKGTAGELPYGLGLSICRQITEAHNGSIWFESEPGKGTSFFVKLPA